VYIAGGHEPDVLYRLANGEHAGTLFPKRTSRMESRKRWMVSGLATKGCIIIDAGAAKALVERKTSLLPAGVRSVTGSFKRGDGVSICLPDESPIACGITNYGADELAVIGGMRSDKIEQALGYQYGSEVVHRNNLVVL
jgi:glutamate 5-kinase